MNLPNIPVPQADDLDKVFEVAELVANGADTALEIAERLGMVKRQGFYYTAAAEQLDLVSRDEDGVFSLTNEGYRYVQGGEKRRDIRRDIVLGSPLVKYLAGQLGIQRTRQARNVPELLSDTAFVAGALEDTGLSTETALRRAYTVRAWMKSLAA